MKVLIFGATGFIGNDAALALIRAGHEVIGTTRSAESARKLEAAEITPKVCDPLDPSQYADLIGQVDVVIDTVGGDTLYKVGHTILDTCISESAKARPHGPPLAYIYCSGTWVHGDDKTEIISDMSPITRPMPLTAWRLEIESKALKAISKSFTANVIRPSLLYGGSGSLIGATLFQGAKEGKITWYGDEDTRCATIHKEDLGEAFRLCAEKAYAIPGIIFDISNNYPEALAHIITQLQAVSGTYKTVYHKPENDFHRALNSTALLRPTLARSLLGWEPRKPPLAEGMKVYYHAWLASTA